MSNPAPYSPTSYSEPFWKAIGTTCESIDKLDAERPTFVSDLSIPRAIWESGLAGRYHNVIDLGTGEHVADQMAYWSNLSDALADGGRLIGVLPADGLCGHGLYQYSPEFFHRMGGFMADGPVGWFVYGPVVRFVPFDSTGRHQRKFRWPAYVFFCIRKTSGGFAMPVQYENASTPTTKPRSGRLIEMIAEIPGIRALERLIR